jgi:Fe-S-cluster-containing hydrogenase component 2
MKVVRKIVEIDEEKCNGCGECVPSCHEGAIRIIDGKARLVSDVYCDGLGNCLGQCPVDAITIVEREAAEFDEAAVKRHLVRQAPAAAPSGCPGTRAQLLREAAPTAPAATAEAGSTPSQLGNWPLQLHLVPVRAPHYDGARLLIAADCVPFAYAGFHSQLLAGKTLTIGCPKLDDTDLYRHKLAQIFLQNDLESVEVAYMEVPCCYGLVQVVKQALEDSGKSLPVTLTQIGIRGDVLESRPL